MKPDASEFCSWCPECSEGHLRASGINIGAKNFQARYSIVWGGRLLAFDCFKFQPADTPLTPKLGISKLNVSLTAKR